MNELWRALVDVDWQQVALNGGPPCFYVENDRFCLRAERWEGHHAPHVFHVFCSLKDLIESVLWETSR